VVIKPSDLVKRIMLLAKMSFVPHYKYIVRMTKCFENVNTTLNRSSPQSVAAAVVYLYICLSPELKESMAATKTKFAQDVNISEMTITKLVRQLSAIVGTPDVPL